MKKGREKKVEKAGAMRNIEKKRKLYNNIYFFSLFESQNAQKTLENMIKYSFFFIFHFFIINS